MASRSLGKNSYFNRLDVNRLETLNLKAESTKESTEKPSYLFSLDIKDGKFENNVLSFNNSDYELLTFTDRPFRYASNNEEGSQAENQLNFLFNLDNSSNSFTEDPPNAVLVTKDGQEVFEILSLSTNNNLITMELSPLKKDLPYCEGKMSLFIDISPIKQMNLLI